MKTFALPALLAAILVAAGAQAQTTYRWVDEQGRVQYSDQPPPPSIRRVEEKRFRSDPADTVDSYAVRQAAAAFPVVLYSSANCGDACGLARDLLNRRGVPFTEMPIATEADLAVYRERLGTPDEVPALTVGTLPLKGFQAAAWNRALDNAGYPSTAQPKR